MNIELHKVMRCQELDNIKEREIILQGNIEPLYSYLEIHSRSNCLILYSAFNEISPIISSLSSAFISSEKTAQYTLISITDKEVLKIASLLSMDIDIEDIVYDLFIKDKELEWRNY